ncbi:MAG: protein TolR [Pseudomonadota bacterium]
MNYRPRRHIVEMNVVPYIDVMLVLLVIFMVTSPLMSNESQKVDTTEMISNVVLIIDEQGNVQLQNNPLNKTIENAEEIAELLKEILKESTNSMVTLDPDKELKYGKLESFIGVLQSKGINISIK